ncbi:MAG: Pup deamidase [Actinomycetota bacterium]
MSIPKICGIETEYGIHVRGSDVSPVVASSMLVNGYGIDTDGVRAWDFQDESPDIDARSGQRPEADFPVVETLMANTILTNGARYYVDHAHPEYSSPECATPLERRSMIRANTLLEDGVELIAHKNNSDGKGNSYGCHENYLVDRNVPFGRLAHSVMAHFVSRQIFCGAGKVGVEAQREGESWVPFQISQRADFFEEEIGLETTIRRPIVNTRDEPHCDAERWRRLHVIAGDANMSEVATYLKLGTTALVLGLIEDKQFPMGLVLKDPVTAIRRISHDPSLQQTVESEGGKLLSALNLQIALYEACKDWFESIDVDPTGGCGGDILHRWGQVLQYLQNNDSRLSTTVDWWAKLQIVQGMQERHQLRDGDLRLRAVDLQYHDMRSDKCLARKIGLETLVTPNDVNEAVVLAPRSTRAYFRGACISRWPQHVVSANWDSIVFDVGQTQLQRVSMPDPMKGTFNHVSELLNRVGTIDELLAELGSETVEPYEQDPGW